MPNPNKGYADEKFVHEKYWLYDCVAFIYNGVRIPMMPYSKKVYDTHSISHKYKQE